MTTARDVMTPGAECVRTEHTAADAARQMTERGVGALPICGKDDKIKGVVTDRDLVVKVLGHGRDPGSFPAGDLNQQEAVTAGADDSVDQVLSTMTAHQVRRLPVIDRERLVGMVAVADLARALPDAKIGELVDVLSTD
ncbi:CBS domain-containing protein [Saccharopolyspora sp. HNM0983]|uniref:CBS domain-containing protein n=1 Tax=Saccharopolyspora montiporae TaxID=2781240 RepID=A0A929B5P1_9PSEU|nr:CBS domain-containing protein [Saccharopolyspora sp. HNM0983]MBE9373664.1 CBS domain-containing protein [Saccharopolyspora sp. HNM0983]